MLTSPPLATRMNATYERPYPRRVGERRRNDDPITHSTQGVGTGGDLIMSLAAYASRTQLVTVKHTDAAVQSFVGQ
jgi:hypothetical protein